MSKRINYHLLLFIFLTLGLLSETVTPAWASSAGKPRPPTRFRTRVRLEPLGEINMGDPLVLRGTVTDTYANPVVGKSVIFTINDEYLGQARSDEDGEFMRSFNSKLLSAGTYVIKVTSNRTRLLWESSSTIELRVKPAEIKVQTIPPISNVTFQLDGQTFFSDANGFASIEVLNVGTHRLYVLAEKYVQPTQRIEFGRWMAESFEPYLDIQVPNDELIQVGMEVYHLVSQSFLGPDGKPVNPERVTQFMIRSAQGDVFILKDGKPRWLPASRVTRRLSRLEETKLLYSVNSVMVDGSNVVNQSQQRFYTHPGDNWKISLIFYSLRASAYDGLFGNRIGKSINLEFPDGSIKNYPLDQNGEVEIHLLPRGNYFLEFVGVNGLSNRAPVALSRDQEVHTKVLTFFDIGVVGLFGVIVAGGLALYGRPWLLKMVFGRKQLSTPVNEPVGVHYER